MKEKTLILYPNTWVYLSDYVLNILRNDKKAILLITWEKIMIFTKYNNITQTTEQDINKIKQLISIVNPHNIIFDDYALDILVNYDVSLLSSQDDIHIIVCLQWHTYYYFYSNAFKINDFKTIHIPVDFLSLKLKKYPKWRKLKVEGFIVEYLVRNSTKRNSIM